MEKQLAIIIPTYNEKDNIEYLITQLASIYKTNHIHGEIIVVDDNSPDRTGNVVEKLAKNNKNIKIIHRAGKLGLSSAVLEGFAISDAEVVGVMDADLSHPAEKIVEMFKIINDNKADFVVGSRYIPGGKIVGWNAKRKIMSKTATLMARVFTSVKDPMSGFFLIKKKCLSNVKLNPKGFKILLELLLKEKYQKVVEIPITFVNRTKGESKAGFGEIFYYIRNLLGYLFSNRKLIDEFVKFALVGLSGAIINIAILYWLTEYFGVYYIFSAICAFIIAVTTNFLFNKIWTFKENLTEGFSKKYAQFFSVSLAALAVNILFLYIFTELFGIYYIISQVIAICIALIINFLGNKIWTFKK